MVSKNIGAGLSNVEGGIKEAERFDEWFVVIGEKKMSKFDIPGGIMNDWRWYVCWRFDDDTLFDDKKRYFHEKQYFLK